MSGGGVSASAKLRPDLAGACGLGGPGAASATAGQNSEAVRLRDDLFTGSQGWAGRQAGLALDSDRRRHHRPQAPEPGRSDGLLRCTQRRRARQVAAPQLGKPQRGTANSGREPRTQNPEPRTQNPEPRTQNDVLSGSRAPSPGVDITI